MAFKSSYTGQDIDRILSKGIALKEIESGCIKLESSVNDPVNLNDLTGSGLYIVDHWTNGPSALSTITKGPILVYSYIGLKGAEKTFVQVISIGPFHFSRTKSMDGDFDTWASVQSNSQIDITETPPVQPHEGSLWIEKTTDAGTSTESYVLKIYNKKAGKWLDIKSNLVMDKTVYDPNNKATDIFKYVDDKIAEANINSVALDFNSHIGDTNIHITRQEKEAWSNSITQEELTTQMDIFKEGIKRSIDEKVVNVGVDAETLTTNVNQYKEQLEQHVGNTTMHPTEEMIARWDAKADRDHTHILDGNVKINATQIEGVIPADKIDRAALERVIEVPNNAAKLALTKEQVQNGDTIYVTDDAEFYFVIDDTKLNVEEGYKIFASSTKISWSAVTNKPTTIAGYGITDAVDKVRYNDKMDKALSRLNKIENNADALRLFTINNFSKDLINAALKKLNELQIDTEKINTLKQGMDAFEDNIDEIEALLTKIEPRI